MINRDSITATPFQLTSWNVEYDPVAEGALAPNLYINIPDTIGHLSARITASADSLQIGVAFKNVSTVNMDSIVVKVTLYDSLNNAFQFPISRLRPLPAGDTIHINLKLDVTGFRGMYNVYLQVNPNNTPPEQFSFNNFLYKYVYVSRAATLPVTLLNFNASLIGNNVQTTWLVNSELNTRQYIVQHSRNGTDFTSIGKQFPTAATGSKTYRMEHANPVFGKNYYRLQIVDNDGSLTYSPARLVTIASATVVNVYPNPVKDKLNVSVARRDGKASVVKLTNAAGQQLWQQKVTGTTQIDMTRWAIGLYLLHVDDGVSKKTFKINKQ
jgi:hypothetical protein